MGQVVFSPAIHSTRVKIYAWMLLLRKAEGKKVSSRLLQRVLKKAEIPPTARGSTPQTCKENLKASHHSYFSLRKSAPAMRAKHLQSLASAWAEHGNNTKEKMLRLLQHREQIKSAHQKIKLLRGKLERNSTTMVTVPTGAGDTFDLTKKCDIERAILKENAAKFQQFCNSLFYSTPLASDFGSKALTPVANQVLLGVYSPPPEVDTSVAQYITQLAFPTAMKTNPLHKTKKFILSLDDHIRFWKGAKETTSCFPCA
jgi:hypothetical protein